MTPGNWKQDFYAVEPCGEGFSLVQPVHVFVGTDDSVTTEPVGFAMTPEAYAASTTLVN